MTTGVGMHASTGAGTNAVKVALFDVAVAALAAAAEVEVDVAFGFVWPGRWPDTFAVTAVRTDAGEGAVGPQRRRQVRVQVDVNVVAFRVTDDERVTHDRAFGLLDVVDQAVRVDPTLGGAALWCFVDQVISDGATAEDDAGSGRITEVAATFAAQIIVTN